MSTAEHQVTGMSCGHSEGAIRAEVSRIHGVIDVEISTTTGPLTVIVERTHGGAAVPKETVQSWAETSHHAEVRKRM